MVKSTKEDRDFALALELAFEESFRPVGVTENAVVPKHLRENDYKPKTLIDNTLELIDPTPNIHTLFVQFNATFFWNKLLTVEVKWSSRMTSCAGSCTFRSRNHDCVITLSAPLLKLRPRKDIVETLLHEMIHGYLFLTNNDRDRDGHGPEFHKHMHRINKEAGTNITVYHNFHEEVRLYQTHWWRCNGPCQHRPPYFGTVRRACNRAPGPSDLWWSRHQATCGGQFIKVREPEKAAKKRKTVSGDGRASKGLGGKDISNWLTKDGAPGKNVPAKSNGFASGAKTTGTGRSDITKLGNGTNNVHGWGTGGPDASRRPSGTTKPDAPKYSSSGKIGGGGSGRSNLLDKFVSPAAMSRGDGRNEDRAKRRPTSTPSRNKVGGEEEARSSAATKSSRNTAIEESPGARSRAESASCPVCRARVSAAKMNEHLDGCLLDESELRGTPGATARRNIDDEYSVIELSDDDDWETNLPLVKIESPPSLKRKSTEDAATNGKQPRIEGRAGKIGEIVNCPVCGKAVRNEKLNDHLDVCLATELADSFDDEIVSSSGSPNAVRAPEETDAEMSLISRDSRRCLVCREAIKPGCSLEDHLEICVAAVFNDDSTSFDDDDEDVPVKGEGTNAKDKFPCPICMELVYEDLMNGHLDVCIDSQK